MSLQANALKKALGWKEFSSGIQDYSQIGSDIPPRHIQSSYAQESGGPLQGQTLISSDPSFSVYPDIDSPEVDRWVEGLRSQPGYKPAKLDMNRFNQRLIDLRDEVHRTLRGA